MRIVPVVATYATIALRKTSHMEVKDTVGHTIPGVPGSQSDLTLLIFTSRD